MGLLPVTLLRTKGGILPWRQLLWRRALRPALGLLVFQRVSPRLRGLLRLQLLRVGLRLLQLRRILPLSFPGGSDSPRFRFRRTTIIFLGSSCVSGGYSKMHERRGIIPSLEPGFGGWFLTN